MFIISGFKKKKQNTDSERSEGEHFCTKRFFKCTNLEQIKSCQNGKIGKMKQKLIKLIRNYVRKF